MPDYTPSDLAGIIVAEYLTSYPSGYGITQSAVDISELENLVARIDTFASQAHTEWDRLESARNNTQEYHRCAMSCWGVDLWDFADEVHSRVVSTEIKSAALELKNAVDDFVISEQHSTDMAGSHGIAVYFPSSQTAFENDPDHSAYNDTNTFMPVDFVRFHTWDNWLTDFYSNAP